MKSDITSPKIVELRPGYSIPRLVNGGWQLAAGHSEHGRTRREIRDDLIAFVEAGCVAFDCADIYTGVEETLGDLIREVSRRHGSDLASKIRIHTKCVPDLDLLPRLSKADVSRVIERSLQRLGRERLDLVQFHWWDYEISGYVETAWWLDELRREGKIRHLGLTNFDTPRLSAILSSGVEIVSHQVQYSLLDRRPAGDMARLCSEHDIALLTYGTLAGGFLSPRYLAQPEPAAPLENRSLVKYKLIIEEAGGWARFQDLLRTLHHIAQRHGSTLSLVALRWVLDQPGVAAAIVGARGATHLHDNLTVFDLRLDEEDHRTIGSALNALASPPGDVYELERIKSEPHAAIMRYNLSCPTT